MINFCYTNIPKDEYKEKVNMGSIVIIHLNPIEQKDDTYLCVECSVSNDQLDLVETEYNKWVLEQKDKQLTYAKYLKIKEIEDYDTSDNVNNFQLNGLSVWLDKDTRVGLMNSTTIAKNLGNENTILWLNGIKLTINCDIAIQLLSALEMYALECFNVTAAHKKEVNELSTEEEVQNYDITKDYPEQLKLTF